MENKKFISYEALAIFDYTPTDENHLELKKGDKLIVIGNEINTGDGLIKARKENDKEGYVSIHYIKKITDKNKLIPKLKRRKTKKFERKKRAIALFDFIPPNDRLDILAINKDDIIEIKNKKLEGWWNGVLNGKKGLVSEKYIKFIEDITEEMNTSSSDLNTSYDNTSSPTLQEKDNEDEDDKDDKEDNDDNDEKDKKNERSFLNVSSTIDNLENDDEDFKFFNEQDTYNSSVTLMEVEKMLESHSSSSESEEDDKLYLDRNSDVNDTGENSNKENGSVVENPKIVDKSEKKTEIEIPTMQSNRHLRDTILIENKNHIISPSTIQKNPSEVFMKKGALPFLKQIQKGESALFISSQDMSSGIWGDIPNKVELKQFYFDLISLALKGAGYQNDEHDNFMNLVKSKANQQVLVSKATRDISLIKKHVDKVNTRLRPVEAAIKIQAYIRAFLIQKKVKILYSKGVEGEQERAFTRLKLEFFKSLVVSERSYLQSIVPILGFYLQPLKHELLKDHKKLKIGSKDVSTIFNNIEQIVTLHTQLLNRLSELDKDWPFLTDLGKVFVDIAPSFKDYSYYVENCTNAKFFLTMLLQSNPKFARWLVDTERHVGLTTEGGDVGAVTSRLRRSSVSINSSRKSNEIPVDNEGNIICRLKTLLDIPISRLSFYESAWKGLVDKTPSDHPQQRSISDSYSILQQTASILSKKSLESTIRAKILDVERKLVSSTKLELITQGRVFIAEQTFQNDHLFLFSDCLIVAKAKQKGKVTHEFKEILDINKFNLVDKGKTKFKVEIEEEQPNKKTKKKLIAYKFSTKNPEEKEVFFAHIRHAQELLSLNRVFGVDLSVTIKREGRVGGVPGVVEMCGECVLKNGRNIEGIFRVATNIDSRNKAKESFNQSSANLIDLKKFSNEGDVPILAASLLKDYLRDLPAPLLRFEHYQDFLQAQDTFETEGRSKTREEAKTNYITNLKNIIAKLQEDHQHLLFYMLKIMNLTSQNSSVNKMTAFNLAIVLAPNILRPKVEDMEYSLMIPKVNSVVEFLINNYELLSK
eukprot:TRINITY_DN367_c0_g1_i1.p1 TRINITY_DN367_c0_g1~~TRINITY_DN367_c0_g1_i1.p1  ORF type:complete len:1043 (-),score=301.79 TRINITY_DN367_c0_g1_i1:16-3144(-)